MRPASPFLIAGLLLAYSPLAHAGLFGGFATDGQYLRGKNQLCSPVIDKSAAASCKRASEADLAKLSFDKGKAQRGSSAKLTVSKRGSTLEVRAQESGELIFQWDAGNVIAALGGAYLDESGRRVAVEYSSRMGGRQVDELIVMQLARSLLPGVPDKAAPPALVTPKAAPGALPAPATESPEFLAAMGVGRKWDKKRKHAKAIAAFEQALKLSPGQPEALYRRARSHILGKDKAAALLSLAELASSQHAEGPRWRVEARFDQAFKSLRLDPAFRAAVGIDRKAGEKVSGYERLVGLGGRWEQAGLPCEAAEVSLDLKRDDASHFNLVVRSKCQGSVETTRLDGSWAAKGDLGLRLHFPNMDSDDEDLSCQIELCSDSSGEDCLRCQWDSDEILFRTVRR